MHWNGFTRMPVRLLKFNAEKIIEDITEKVAQSFQVKQKEANK
jgi:hypothetical protein